MGKYWGYFTYIQEIFRIALFVAFLMSGTKPFLILVALIMAIMNLNVIKICIELQICQLNSQLNINVYKYETQSLSRILILVIFLKDIKSRKMLLRANGKLKLPWVVFQQRFSCFLVFCFLVFLLSFGEVRMSIVVSLYRYFQAVIFVAKLSSSFKSSIAWRLS